jgi:glutamate--cysteine ligase
VNQNKLRFLEAFAAMCVLKPSAPLGPSESDELDANHVVVARRGREPGLELRYEGRDIPLRSWALSILDEMAGVCELLDAGDPRRPYSSALAVQQAKILDVTATPSARLLVEMREQGDSFSAMALRMSRAHKGYFMELYPPNDARLDEFQRAATESLDAQRRVEANDTLGFDEFVARYFA